MPSLVERIEEQTETKLTSASYTIKASIVLPPDTNHHGTIFGGKLMAYIDEVATIAATRHARRPVVTASTDSVDFLHPVKTGDTVCLSAFVAWSHKTSMEVFVRVITENLLTGERKVSATSFLTFVALDEEGRPTAVPAVQPVTEEEQMLFDTAMDRRDARKTRRQESRRFAEYLGVDYRLGRQEHRPHLHIANEADRQMEAAIAPDRQKAAAKAAATAAYASCWEADY